MPSFKHYQVQTNLYYYSLKSIFLVVAFIFGIIYTLRFSGTRFILPTAPREGDSFPDYTPLPVLSLNILTEPDFSYKRNFFVFAYSKPGDFAYRTAVRTTWGKRKVLDNLNGSLVFPLGLTTNRTVMRNLLRESRKYKDILIGKFTDSYHNLTYKGQLMLQWLFHRNLDVNYFVKVDSDVFPNLFSLRALLVERRPQNERFMICKMNWHSPVLRPDTWCGKMVCFEWGLSTWSLSPLLLRKFLRHIRSITSRVECCISIHTALVGGRCAYYWASTHENWAHKKQGKDFTLGAF